MASDVLMTISRDEIERDRIMREEKTRLDWQSYMAHERKEGRKEEREEIALNALAKGLPLETIQDITGMDLDTIKTLGRA